MLFNKPIKGDSTLLPPFSFCFIAHKIINIATNIFKKRTEA